MIFPETPRGRIRVARGSGTLSRENQKLVDEAVARGRAGAMRIMAKAAERNAASRARESAR